MIRQWKFISGYKDYMVTDQGEVFRCSQLATFSGAGGYPVVSLSKNGEKKTVQVHRLVLEAFLGRRPLNFVCHHKDKNRKNNALSNLEWISRSAHGKIHPRRSGGKKNHKDIASDNPLRGERVHSAKLTADKVKLIRRLWPQLDYSMNRLAKEFNVTMSTISKIVNRKSWAHVV